MPSSRWRRGRVGDSLARYGSGLLPVDWKPEVKNSPIFNYPYARTREALEALTRAQDIDPCHGIKLRYVNPATGDYAMPTMATFMQLLPKGFSTAQYRSTDSTVYVAVEGEGETRLGDKIFTWKTARHLRRAELDAAQPSSRGRRRAVQLLRPPGARKARPLARAALRQLTPPTPKGHFSRLPFRALV